MRATRTLTLAVVSALAACADPAAGPDPIGRPPGGCADLGRPLFEFYQLETSYCGPRLPPLREIVPAGGGAFLVWVPQSGYAQLWKPIGTSYGPVTWTQWANVRESVILAWAFEDRIVSLHQKSAELRLWRTDLTAEAGADPLRPQSRSAFTPTALTRELAALDADHMLVWFPGDGRFAIHLVDRLAANEATALVVPPLVEGKDARFLRGHEIVALDATRLLEWEPRTGDYRIWSLSLASSAVAPFGATPLVAGRRADLAQDLAADRDVQLMLLDRGQLLLWNRPTGRIDAVAFASGQDPLAEGEVRLLAASGGLRSRPRGYEPPTRSAIARVVILLQRGRSFDFYFGRSCRAPADGAASCTDGGMRCCEAMPDTTPGAAACFGVDPATDDFVPDETPACLADKIDGGAMDHFVTSGVPGCGDPRNFACVPPGASAYHGLAARGALADRFFQSTAKNSGQQALFESNLFYLAVASHGIGAIYEQTGDSINGQLARAGVPWALYLEDPVGGLIGQKEPLSSDAHWSHFRYFEELERDIQEERLGPVSVVLAPSALSEQPGAGPPGRGAAFVEQTVDALEASPRYGRDTLVLVTYLTAGGLYDHVRPPPDDTSERPAQPYGPRVPLLAFGPFVTPGHVSHEPLELSSLTAFMEWNWLPEGTSLYGRDRRVNDIGSLLNAAAAREGMAVPAGPNPSGP
jgi:phospholipase C